MDILFEGTNGILVRKGKGKYGFLNSEGNFEIVFEAENDDEALLKIEEVTLRYNKKISKSKRI